MMRQELRQLFNETPGDLTIIHETALQLGDIAGLPIPEKISFAAELAVLCYKTTSPGNSILFTLEKNEKVSLLKATATKELNFIERQLPADKNFPVLPASGSSFWKTRRQLEESYDDMQQFTFAISHDLKNSLTKLKLALSLVGEEQFAEPVNTYVQIINRSAERLEKTMLSLNQLIELGFASASTVRTIPVAKVFEEVYDEFADSLLRVNASVSASFDGQPEINYVEAYLKSIFSNLLSNSIKYRLPDRPLQIKIELQPTADGVVLVFADNGQGLDMDKCGQKLFLPFTRFSTHVDGSGIGLYLIRSMVERNGGSVQVESAPGQGTCFRFLLKQYPLVPVTDRP